MQQLEQNLDMPIDDIGINDKFVYSPSPDRVSRSSHRYVVRQSAKLSEPQLPVSQQSAPQKPSLSEVSKSKYSYRSSNMASDSGINEDSLLSEPRQLRPGPINFGNDESKPSKGESSNDKANRDVIEKCVSIIEVPIVSQSINRKVSVIEYSDKLTERQHEGSANVSAGRVCDSL